MKTPQNTQIPQETQIRAFKSWLKTSEGIKAVQQSRDQAKEEAVFIESISQVEVQKLKEPFTIKP